MWVFKEREGYHGVVEMTVAWVRGGSPWGGRDDGSQGRQSPGQRDSKMVREGSSGCRDGVSPPSRVGARRPAEEPWEDRD